MNYSSSLAYIFKKKKKNYYYIIIMMIEKKKTTIFSYNGINLDRKNVIILRERSVLARSLLPYGFVYSSNNL